MNITTGILFVISAPTGAGKTTVSNRSIRRLVDKNIPIEKLITYTTRLPRAHERNGVDYHFISESNFLHKRDNNFFLETTFYDGNWYGSAQSILDDIKNKKILILITDRSGAKTIKSLIPQSVLIWIDVPNLATVADRLNKRTVLDNEHNHIFERRIALAHYEIDEEIKEKAFDYHVMNNNLNAAIDQVCNIIVEKVQALSSPR